MFFYMKRPQIASDRRYIYLQQIRQSIHSISMASIMPLEKYSQMRSNLAEDNSQSDQQNLQINQTICELLPVYYRYRKYLLEMLKQTNFNLRSNSNLVIPEQYLQEKTKKCEEEKELYEEKIRNNSSSRVSRLLVTEKILQKKRKKLKEEMQLQRKYQAQQIQALISRQPSNKRIEQQLTFQRRYSGNQKSTQKIKQSSQKLLYNQGPNRQEEPSNSSHNQEQPIKQEWKKARKGKSKEGNEDSLNMGKIGNGNAHVLETDRFDRILQTQNQCEKQEEINGLQNQVNQSPVSHLAYKSQFKQVRSSNFKSKQGQKNYPSQKINALIQVKTPVGQRNRNQEVYENSVKQGTPKKRKLSSNSSNRGKLEDIEFEEMPPKITINYRHLENDGYSEGQSQDDNFSDIEYNGASNFEAQHKYQDETHSEQRARPYSRHNTPNFDTFSQKVKTNKFLELQKQKLLAQQEFAEKIHSEVDEAIEDSISISSKIDNQLLKDSQSAKKLKKASIANVIQREVGSQYLSSLRHMLSQICDLYSQAECYKYMLKNKQYQILRKLYDEEVGKGPIFTKSLTKNIQLLLKDQEKSETNVIINKICGSQQFISFDDFGNAFSSNIFENEFSLLNSQLNQWSSPEAWELVSKLFSVWLELNYFENKIRKISLSNQAQIPSIGGKVTKITDQSVLDYEELEKFIYSTIRSQSNRLKIKLFCSKNFPLSKFAELAAWLQGRSIGK